jgi:hypothetical protein
MHHVDPSWSRYGKKIGKIIQKDRLSRAPSNAKQVRPNGLARHKNKKREPQN